MNYIYLMRAGENHYKIGVAQNVNKRLAGIQTGSPHKVELVTAKLVEDAYTIEGELHNKLRDMKADGGTEWFVLSSKQVIELCVAIHRLPDIDISNNIKLRDILAQHSQRQRIIEQKLDGVINIAMSREERRQAAAELRAAELEMERIEKEQRSVKRRKSELTDQELMDRAAEIAKSYGSLSTSRLQRDLRVGYGKAARIIDRLESQGILGELNGIKPREYLGQAL